MTVDKIKISIAMSCSPKGDCGIGLRSKYAKVREETGDIQLLTYMLTIN